MIEEDNDDFRDDEIMLIKLPRYKYQLLKKMIDREEAYGWFTNAIRNNIIWIIGSGVLTLILLWNEFNVGVGK